jgi:O6-methylguanine-DNA--protein-cysteine methyltransferase
MGNGQYEPSEMNNFLAKLKSALAVRGQQAAPLRLFFRNDDVDEDEAPLRRLLGLFLERETPINLGVIPGRLTAACAELLAQSVSAAPALLELNQHGWLHLNYEREGRKCEFGPSRTYAEQLADIARGQARMTEAFGPNWFPVFIPPWNRCTEKTHRALSAKRRDSVATGYRFKEISITLDPYRWEGGARLKSPEEIIDDLIAQLSRQQAIGVMLHHKVMDEQAFSFLGSMLDALAWRPAVRFHTFQSLLHQDIRRL